MSLKLVSESVILVVLLSISSSSGFVVAKCGECPEIPAPICGSDGITWPSKCVLECEMRIKNKDIKVVHEGVCSTKTETKNTELISTYPMKIDQANILNNKTAKSDANTKTPNSGQSNAKSVTTEQANAGIKRTEQGNASKSEPAPVKTQKTEQAMTKQSSGSNDNYKEKPESNSLTTVDRITEGCACTKILKPVCGTDGVTYNSVCLLQCARQKNANLEVFGQGSCDQKNRGKRSVYDLRYSIHRASPCSF